LTEREMEHVEQQLAVEQIKRGELEVKSPSEGRLVIASPDDVPGKFVRRGSAVGYAVQPATLLVRAIVRQDDIGLVRSMLERISLRLAGSVQELRSGDIVRMTPSASDRLPTLALSTTGGGRAALDPQERREPRSVQSYFEYQIAFTGSRDRIAMGQRAYVQFVLGAEPIGFQILRRLRQLFLRQLNV
jgi:putative peptide zinc metalloprotease protein